MFTGSGDVFEKILGLTIFAIPVVLAITLHEAAHAYAAYRLGDNTAKLQGRVSLNPLVHVDPVGTILMPLILYLLGGFIFGYAKPVPVRFDRLNNPRRDSVLVALAGPGANIFLALMGGLLLHIGAVLPGFVGDWFVQNLLVLIFFNTFLAVLNMLPIPPLDGGRVAVGLLPYRQARSLAQIEPYGIFILIAIIIIIPMFFDALGIGFDPGDFLVRKPAEYLAGLVFLLTGAGS